MTAPDRTPASAQVTELIELAHRQALEVVELRRELDVARGRVAALDQEAGARWEAEAQLAVTTAALDRLRALPELRVGQRVRHTARRLRPGRPGPEADPAPDEIDTPPPDDGAAPEPGGVPASRSVATGEHPTGERPAGMGYPEHPAPAAIVVVRDRRSGLPSLLAWLDDHGIERVEIVDDGSTDPATIELLASLERPVHRVESGLGSGTPWAIGLVAELSLDEPVLVIDADTLPAEDCPDDTPARLRHELQRAPDVDAVALGSTRDPGRSSERPDGAAEATPVFLLVRDRLPYLPRRTATLAAPYLAACASWTAAADPAERYARQARQASREVPSDVEVG